MTNELLFIILLLLQFSLTVLMYKLFGKLGLFVWVGAGIIIANIQVVKTVELFGLYATLGNSIYASIYLSTDLLSEKYGKKDAKNAVYIGFLMMIAFSVIMSLVIAFAPAPMDFADESIRTLFSIMPRITAASLCAYIISQLLDVTLFFKIKERFGKPGQLWIRNNASTLLSQFVDTCVFVSIAFIGVYEWNVLVDIFVTTYLFKVISAILDTPFVYLMRAIKPRNEHAQ